MSGVRRAILAELASKGITGEAAQAALSPANQLKEKGISIHNGSAAKGEDPGEYLGKKANDATPGR